jgi:hypothetical protein
MYDQFDVVVKRLSKKLGDSWIQVFSPEEKSKISQVGLDPNKVSMEYLTDEEDAYEKYVLEDVPFVSRPTSVSYVNRVLSKLIQQADIDFGTNLKEEFVEWAEKEKKEWAEKNKNNNSNSENTETTENEVTEETSNVNETVETSNEELPTEVEEPTPTVTKKVVKTTSFDVLALKTIFPYIDKLTDEEKKHIIGYDEASGKLKFDSSSEVCECPCGADVEMNQHICQKCGSIFEN